MCESACVLENVLLSPNSSVGYCMLHITNSFTPNSCGICMGNLGLVPVSLLVALG